MHEQYPLNTFENQGERSTLPHTQTQPSCAHVSIIKNGFLLLVSVGFKIFNVPRSLIRKAHLRFRRKFFKFSPMKFAQF